jgi:hypothetical protein
MYHIYPAYSFCFFTKRLCNTIGRLTFALSRTARQSRKDSSVTLRNLVLGTRRIGAKRRVGFCGGYNLYFPLDLQFCGAAVIKRWAAACAPSLRTAVAMDWARAVTSGWRVCLRALVSESVVGVPGACAVPMPRWWTRWAQ